MSATLTHQGLPPGINRNEFRRIVKTTCRQIFQLPELAVSVVDHLFDQTQDKDFEAGNICGSWMSARNVAAMLGKSERRICETEKLIENAGLVARTNGNDRRAGERRGTIRWLRGINLAPLIDRASEIIAQVNAWERAQAETDAAIRQTRCEIRQLRQRIREEQDAEALARADAVSNCGRTSRIADIDQLTEMADALQAIVDRIKEASGARESAHLTAKNRAPNTNSESNSESCSAPSRPNPGADQVSVRQALLIATPHFRERFEYCGYSGWRGVEEVARAIALEHGIHLKTWQAMCQRWSPITAALTILLVERNSRLPDGHRYQARSFVRCFAGLARNPSSVWRMAKAAMGYPEGDLVERQFEPERVYQDDSQRIGIRLSGMFDQIAVREGLHD
ncbi:MAG: helix-turn-helix domain-containing protein [Sphingomonadaceae bacterium]